MEKRSILVSIRFIDKVRHLVLIRQYGYEMKCYCHLPKRSRLGEYFVQEFIFRAKYLIYAKGTYEWIDHP